MTDIGDAELLEQIHQMERAHLIARYAFTFPEQGEEWPEEYPKLLAEAERRGIVFMSDERKVLQQIMQVLGPEATCACAGCNWETNEVLRLVRSVGIEYQPRHAAVNTVKHDKAAERRGNEVE